MNFSLCKKLMYFGLKSLWEPCLRPRFCSILLMLEVLQCVGAECVAL